VHATRSKSHTILSAICSAGVVNVSLRKPVKFQTKKRKLGQDTAKKKKKKRRKEQRQAIIFRFLLDTVNIMDQHQEYIDFFAAQQEQTISPYQIKIVTKRDKTAGCRDRFSTVEMWFFNTNLLAGGKMRRKQVCQGCSFW
jgi:hypothetical protein